MDLTSSGIIKNLLKKYEARPIKGLGQNFLIDKGALKKILEAAEIKPNDTILEIGPGIGTLTQEIAKTAKKVIAVEKDPRMVEILRETLRGFGNIEIVRGDILKLNFQYPIPNSQSNSKSQIPKNYKIVANLPYYIVSPVIRKFLEFPGVQSRGMVLMAQKEVAQRICAKPPRPKGARLASQRGAARMNLLAVSVQFYASPKIISYVSKKSFWPRPKVDSAILRIAPLVDAGRNLIDADLFFRIVKAGFAQPRKQLGNNLFRPNFASQNLGGKLNKEEVQKWLRENGIQPTQRAETLSIQDWIHLTKNFPQL